MRGLFFLIAAVTLPIGSIAANTQQGEPPCIDVEISQQVYECIVAKYKAADSVLNETYKQVMAKIAADHKETPKLGEDFKLAVKKAQQAWIKFMESNCAAEAFDIDPGTSAYATAISGCRSDMTIQRIKELQNLLQKP
jgi:uncharacterized protein YecT (DUF1311 family)